MSKFLRGNRPEYVYGKIVQVKETSKATSNHLGISRRSLNGKKFRASFGSWTYARLYGTQSCTGSYLIDGTLPNGKYFQLTNATIQPIAESEFK